MFTIHGIKGTCRGLNGKFLLYLIALLSPQHIVTGLLVVGSGQYIIR